MQIQRYNETVFVDASNKQQLSNNKINQTWLILWTCSNFPAHLPMQPIENPPCRPTTHAAKLCTQQILCIYTS